MELLQAVWFVLVGVLIIGYAILDGFDLGAGVLHLFARTEEERRISLNAVGPVWDGNEVWLLTAGGALFAAFPPVYATVFSGFYLALMLLLVALIARAVSLEFRGKIASAGWKRFWDRAFGIGSLLPAVLFGVAFGNILRGIPLDERTEFAGTFLGLLNPFALLVGLLSLALFVMHGAVYLTLKTDGDFRARMVRVAARLWIAVVALYGAATAAAAVVAPFLFEGTGTSPVFWVLLPGMLIALAVVPLALGRGLFPRAFFASSVLIACMVGLSAWSLFPRLVPASNGLEHSLTISNASSTERTLTVMLVVALVGMPLVIAYTVFIHRVFRGRVVIGDDSY